MAIDLPRRGTAWGASPVARVGCCPRAPRSRPAPSARWARGSIGGRRGLEATRTSTTTASSSFPFSRWPAIVAEKGKSALAALVSQPLTAKRVATLAGALVSAGVVVDVGRFLASLPPGGGLGLGFGGGDGDGGGGLEALTALYTNDDDEDDDEEGSTGGSSSRFIGSGAEPTMIYDVRGRVIATLMLSPSRSQTFVAGADGKRRLYPRGCVFGVPLRETSDVCWQAIVASEDKRFFRHRGIDLFGIGRAVLSLGSKGGGSTITQQLAKNVALSHSRTLTRKAVELILAVKIERKMKKRAILEAYLNSVYWGHGLWGIAGASAVYFRKKHSELNLGEAALLAGILPAPEHLSPFRNPEAALRARASVLQRMIACGYITEAQGLRATARGLPDSIYHGGVSPGAGPESGAAELGSPTRSGVPFRAPFFVAEVLYQLRGLLSDEDVLRKGGLQIHTTLDLALQERAEEILKEDGKTLRLGEDKGESALVAMEPTTGAVRVLVGGRSYVKSPYNRAMLARRQPGSAFKPIVYLAALETGLVTPRTEVEDEEVVFRRKPGGDKGWTAVSRKDEARLAVEKRAARDQARRQGAAQIKRLREKDERLFKANEDAKAKVRRKLKDIQKRIADYESGCIVKKQSYIDSLLEESTLLEDSLVRLYEQEPEADPRIGELEEFLAAPETETESEGEAADFAETDYQPQNYNRKHRGVVTLRQSLADSLNVPTVKLANLIGVDAVIAMARKLGVRGKLPYELSLALGSCEVTPFEMAHVFNTIAAGGVCSRPHLITKVRDKTNHVVYRHKASKKVVLEKNICADMHRMLRSAVTQGTGRVATRGWPAVAAAGKTGTSDNYRDAWFAGYTPQLTCVIWCGRDDNSSLPGSGATLAAPLWAKFMRAAQGSGIPTEKGMSKRKNKQRWRGIGEPT